MIAKSDLVILVLSASALAVGVVRWQINTSPAPSRTVAAAPVAPSPNDAGELVSRVVDERPAVRRIDGDADGALPDAPIMPDTPTTPTVRVIADPEPVVAATTDSPSAAVGQPLYGVYRVKSGDYLGLIAERFGTTVQTLREINDIRGSTILIGQSIRYPQPAN